MDRLNHAVSIEPDPTAVQPSGGVRANGRGEDDRARGFNRGENLCAIPETDPDFDRLYGRRSEIESINRDIDDRMCLRRARSIGTRRPDLNGTRRFDAPRIVRRPQRS
ncbi:MAG: hypothetical protein QOI55_2064 [Actinomycetota bacterium]|jgi:hypothetical protein|nr:hypothetical protein [Actinomycetota bacterium]